VAALGDRGYVARSWVSTASSTSPASAKKLEAKELKADSAALEADAETAHSDAPKPARRRARDGLNGSPREPSRQRRRART
jgi:hypothetical protein